MSTDAIDMADDYATLKARYWCHHEDVTEGMVRAAREKLESALAQRADEPVGYVNDFGVEVRGYESAMGGLYKNEHIALEVSDGVGPCHSLVRFVDVSEDVKDGRLMQKVKAAMHEFHEQVAAGQGIRSSRDVFFLNVEDVLKDGEIGYEHAAAAPVYVPLSESEVRALFEKACEQPLSDFACAFAKAIEALVVARMRGEGK